MIQNEKLAKKGLLNSFWFNSLCPKAVCDVQSIIALI